MYPLSKSSLAGIMTCLLLASSLAKAETNSTGYWLKKIATGVNQVYAHSVANAQAKLELAKQMLYQPTPELSTTVVANTNQVQPNNTTNSIANVTNQLSYNGDNIDAMINLALLPGSDYQPSSEGINMFGKDKPKLSNPNNLAFNFDALLTPSIMSAANSDSKSPPDNNSQLADYYLKLLAGSNALGIKYLPKKEALMDNSLLFYLVNLRQYVAEQSVGLGNMGYILNERKPIENLAVKAGLPDSDKNPNASPAQIDEYMAKKRAANSNWYFAMETAAPTTITRETLYVLAEMRYEMYRNRQLQERILATLSAIQLHQLQPNGITLQEQKAQLIAGGKVAAK